MLSLQAGSRPGGRLPFLCFAKEKEAKERRAAVRSALRFPALLAPLGVWLNSLRSDNASPDPSAAALLGPASTAQTQYAIRRQNSKPQVRAMARPGRIRYWIHRRHAEASSAGSGGSGLALFERSEFSQTPPGPSNAAYRRSRATHPAVFFFASFLLDKQKKGRRPPGRDPACNDNQCITSNDNRHTSRAIGVRARFRSPSRASEK